MKNPKPTTKEGENMDFSMNKIHVMKADVLQDIPPISRRWKRTDDPRERVQDNNCWNQ